MSDTSALTTAIPLPIDALQGFCERWRVRELAVFGSVLGSEFGPDSDVDFLFTLQPDVRIGLFDLARREAELTEIVGRPVDLVSRRSIERSHDASRRHSILTAARVIVDAA